MQFITRGYNTIAFNSGNGTITKKSAHAKLQDEIEYFKYINNKISDPYLKLLFPRIINSSCSDEAWELELEFYPFRNLGQCLLEDEEYDKQFWSDVLGSLFSIVKRMQRTKKAFSKDKIQDYCYSMFVQKTLNEYNNLKTKFPFFASLCQYPALKINGRSYENFEIMWEKILKQIDHIIREEEEFNVIHGDMCFSNILLGYNRKISNKTIRLIDPRGSFGTQGVYGTSLYDLAKISHSINGGYECFIYDKFEVEREKNSNIFILNALQSKNKKICEHLFAAKFATNPHQLGKIKLIEGLIFIGMCARHYDSLERQKAMYLTGIRILNEVINEHLC